MGPLTSRLAAMLAASAAAGAALGFTVGGPWGLALGWALFFVGCILVTVVEMRAQIHEEERDEALRVLSGERKLTEVEKVQTLLGVEVDNIYGPRTAQAAYRGATNGSFRKTGLVARVHRERTGQVLARSPWYRRLLRHKHG